KCLHHIEKGRLPGNTHRLDRLFLGLTPPTQKRLEQMWDDAAAKRKDILDKIDAAHNRPLPRDLRSNLSAGADGFRLIRYIYEGGTDIEFFLTDLPLILKRRILELRPEWASL